MSKLDYCSVLPGMRKPKGLIVAQIGSRSLPDSPSSTRNWIACGFFG